MHHDSIAHDAAPAPSSERSFGVVFATVLSVVALLPLASHHAPRWWALAGALPFAVCALFAPGLLAPFNRAWSRLGTLLHKLTNPLVLGLIYFAVITPLGLLLRMRGKDLLRLRLDRTTASYWIPRDPPGPAGESLKNPF